jgi:hypothetical protein
MATITKFRCTDEKGQQILCDAFGNNVAFNCSNCNHPMLAIIRENQRGSDANHPAECPNCRFSCWLEDDQVARILRLHAV